MARKTVVTFNLPVGLVERMDLAVARGQRSAFAEKALESALGKTAPVAETPPLQDPAQTRTSEESTAGRGNAAPTTSAAVDRPAPRRSADAKSGVKPRPRAT